MSKLLINHLFSRRSGMRHVSNLLIHLWWLLHSGTSRAVAWNAGRTLQLSLFFREKICIVGVFSGRQGADRVQFPRLEGNQLT